MSAALFSSWQASAIELIVCPFRLTVPTFDVVGAYFVRLIPSIWHWFALGAMFMAKLALADSCGAIFPDGASSTSSGGEVVVGWGGAINNSPDNILATAHLDDNSGGTSCGSTACSSEAYLGTAPVFTNFPSGANVNLGYRETLTLAPGNYRQLSVGNEAVLTLQTGVYTFSFGVSTQFGSTILLESGATVALYSNRAVSFGFGTVNVPDSGELLIYSASTITLNYGAIVNAYIYSERNTTIGNSAVLTGGASSYATITLQSGATINYQSPQASTEFPSFCEGGAAADPVAEFAVDIGSGSASTCSAKVIDIVVKDGGGQTLTDFAGSIAITTSTGHGDWSTTGTPGDAFGVLMPGSADSGSASYQFALDGSDLGVVTLNFNDIHEEVLTVSVSGDGVTSQSASLGVAANTFDMITADSLLDDQIAGRDHAYVLRMMKQDPVSGKCGPASGYNLVQIKVWLARSCGDPGGAAPILINSGGTQSLTLPASSPGSANFTAAFNNGIAAVTLRSADVGEFTLQLEDSSMAFASAVIQGGSGTITVRPFAWDIQVAENPKAQDATGAAFVAAGDAFSVTVRAVAWESGDDLDGDGIADFHLDTNPGNNADLSNNVALSAFGQESPSEAVLLSATLVAPAAGSAAALTSSAPAPADGTRLTVFSDGSGTTGQVYYPEVGIIEVVAVLEDSRYLSASVASTAKIVGRSGYVGRFTPSYFSYKAPVVNVIPFCQTGLAFSYLAQPFTIVAIAEAKNNLGQTTVNYRDDFVKLHSDDQLNLGAIDSVTTNLTARVTHQSTAFSASNGEVTITTPITVARVAVVDGPYPGVDIGLQVADDDGIGWQSGLLDLDVDGDAAADYVRVAQTYLKYGRLDLRDAYGPETADLPVTMEVQYWDGEDWSINLDDSCSGLLLGDIQYPDGSLTVPDNRTITLVDGTTTGQYGAELAGQILFTEGDAQHYFTAPGAENTGTFAVSVSTANVPWLSFDWDQDGDNQDPTLPVRNYQFGVYRGHDRVLYWQETLH